MSHPVWYTYSMNNMKNEQPTYTLWDGSKLLHTYPHTREGSDAAFARAYGLGAGAAIYSSRDDLVWSARDDEKESITDDFAEMDTIYDECDDYDVNSLADD